MDKSIEREEIAIPDAWRARTLEEARGYIRDNKETGVPCPCCGQHVQVYTRKFNLNMGRFLLSLCNKSPQASEWVHYKDCDYASRDYAGVAYWGLASNRKGAKSAGYWRPTQRGLDFINGRIRIPSHVTLFNNKVDWSRGGFSQAQIRFKDVVGATLPKPAGRVEMVGSWEATEACPVAETEFPDKGEEYAEDTRPVASPTPVEGEQESRRLRDGC